MKNLKPSNFTNKPWNCVFKKSEYETIARNIMVIRERLGDTWEELTWETYEKERKKERR